jgi:hypothetical protein
VNVQGDGNKCALWRQDDNGNRILVGIFATREEAQARLEDLSRHPHRQIYWIEAAADASA